MRRPNPTKRLPNTRLKNLYVGVDCDVGWEQQELLVFENAEAAGTFAACLNDEGYGSIRGGFEVTDVDVEKFRASAAYQSWVKEGQRVVSLAYVNWVSYKMDADPEENVASELLGADEIADAYVPVEDPEEWELLYQA